MTRQEILKKLQEAEAALDAFKQQNLTSTKSWQETDENNKIIATSTRVATKSYMLGPAGTQCPKCGGSGRV
jgi:predicted Zn-ribbon and HTH transcriptional regulator